MMALLEDFSTTLALCPGRNMIPLEVNRAQTNPGTTGLYRGDGVDVRRNSRILCSLSRQLEQGTTVFKREAFN